MYTKNRFLRFIADNVDGQRNRTSFTLEEFQKMMESLGAEPEKVERDINEYKAIEEIKEVLVKYGIE